MEVQYVDMSRGTVSKGLVSGVRHSSLVTPNGNAGLLDLWGTVLKVLVLGVRHSSLVAPNGSACL